MSEEALSLSGRFTRLEKADVPDISLVHNGIIRPVNNGFEVRFHTRDVIAKGRITQAIMEVRDWLSDQFEFSVYTERHHGVSYRVYFACDTTASAFRLRWC